MKLEYVIGGKLFAVGITKPPKDFTVSLYCDNEVYKTYSYSNIDDTENAFQVICAAFDMVSYNLLIERH